MASAYLFAMLAITPSESREVALIANPEFEAGPAAGHRARRLIDGGYPGLFADSLHHTLRSILEGNSVDHS